MSEQLKRAQAIVTAARQGEVEWADLEKNIAAELDAARSDLARKVLAEVAKYKAPFALVHGVEGGVIDVTCEQVVKRLEDLFTREKIETGGKNEKI